MNEPAKMVKTIRTIKGFIDWLEEVKGRFVLYRGLADAAWEVESSAYRRIKRSQGEAPPRVFQNYIEQLLNRAGLQGFKRRGGEELSELELLAKLQHNGAATCLIDFTENALVALWFVCREKPKKAGKVVAMATEESEEFSIVTYERLEKPIKEFLNQGKLWKWTPSGLSNRIVAQNSVFVFGEGKIEKERWHYEEIRVAASSKGEIREELKEKFGISEESLFSDFTGFALSNAHDRPYSDYTAMDYLSLGLAFRQRGDFEKAINAFDKALELAPEDMRICRNRGIAKRASGDISGAIADFDQAITLNPEYGEAYGGRGIAKRVSGDHQGAIADFDKVIELNPQSVLAYRNRGLTKRILGDHQDAIADFDKALDLNPQYAQAYVGRGIAKRASGDHQGAIADFNKALELNPRYASAYNHRGTAKYDSGDHQGAIVDLNRAIELNSQFVDAYYNRGLAKFRSGDFKDAIADFEQAISLNPKYVNAYVSRGFAKHELDDYQGAIADYDKAIELETQDAKVFYARGDAKRALGDEAGAQADFAKAQELDPSLEPPDPS